jgi:hypothetical protein
MASLHTSSLWTRLRGTSGCSFESQKSPRSN